MSDDYFTTPGTIMPISVRELLSRSFWICVTNIRTILQVAITVFVPAQIIIGIAGRKLLNRLEYADDESQINHILLFVLILQIVGYLLYSIVEAAVTEIVKNAHAGSADTTFPKAMAVARSCILQIFLVVVLVSFASSLGLCLLIFPGIYLALSWWFVCPVVIVERKGVCQSLSRSWELSSGYRWDLFRIYCTYIVSCCVVVFVVNVVMVILLWPRILRYVLGYCVPVLLFQPMGYILQSVVYFDLRARKESLTRTELVAEIRMKGGGDWNGDGVRFGAVNGPVVIPVTDEESSGNATGNPDWTTESSTLQRPDWTAQSEPPHEEVTSTAGGGLWDNKKETAKEKFRHFEIS